jgi:DNA-binding MarR family transcriptional regulator
MINSKEYQVGANDERDDLGIVFIHSSLDDLGLDPYQFRVYARIARRCGPSENGQGAYESIENMAKGLLMSKKKIKESLKYLLDHGLLKRKTRPGSTSIYTLTSQKHWIKPAPQENRSKRGKGTPSETDPGHNGTTHLGHNGTTHLGHNGTTTWVITEPLRISNEVNPKKVQERKKKIEKEEKKRIPPPSEEFLKKDSLLEPEIMTVEATTIESVTEITSDQTCQNVNANETTSTGKDTSGDAREVVTTLCKIGQRAKESYEATNRIPPLLDYRAWIQPEMGETIKLYRKSGLALNSTRSDINPNFILHVANKWKGKEGESKDFDAGLKLILKLERTPSEWEVLTALVTQWIESSDRSPTSPTSPTTKPMTAIERIEARIKARKESQEQ